MSLLCRLHLHDFTEVDLGPDFGLALECRRCRYQVRVRSASIMAEPANRQAAPPARAGKRRCA